MLGLTEHPHYANDRYSLVEGIFWSILAAGVLARMWDRRGAGLAQMSASCPGDWRDTGAMSKARARGKRYETALRVGTLANLALVSARSARAVEARRQPPAPAPVHADSGQGGHWTWTPTWR